LVIVPPDPLRQEYNFRALIERAYDIVVVLAPDGTILYQSPATERVLGHAADELRGTNVLRLMDPEDQRLAAALLTAFWAWPLSMAS
jgi:PAS domain S-box-containing protein